MRRLGLAAAIGAAALVLAACGSSPASKGAAGSTTTTTTSPPTTTTTTAPLARGVEEPRSAIPWKQVGPGWMLALWGPAIAEPEGQAPPAGQPTTTNQTQTLYLVNPVGGRYNVTSFPAGTNLYLSSWSGDGMRALFTGNSNQAGNTPVTEVNLATGAQHSFTLTGYEGVRYTTPDGLAVLGSTSSSSPAQLQRDSTTGTLQITYPQTFGALGNFNGSSISSADGSELAMGASTGGIALVANSGKLLTNLPVPNTQNCTPARFWSSTEILTSCQPSGNGYPLLWLVPTSGAAPTPFTVAGPTGGADDGDEVAWPVGSAVYLQDAGGCGYQYLSKLNADKTTSPVTVPGVNNGDSQFVLGTASGQIAVLATLSCGPGEALLWFDPTTNTSNVVLGAGLNGGSVSNAILFGTDNGAL
jgi:hypothetical protein